MLDLLLIPQDNLTDAQGVYSEGLATLASGHFPVTALLHVEVLQRQPIKTQAIRRDWTVLQNPDLRRAMSESISTNMSDVPVSNENEYWEKACSVMASAIASLIPVINVRANKPWISSETLELLRLRRVARLGGQWDREKQLRAEVKRSAEVDSRLWQSQFGFRKGRCTENAIYVALRKVEQACARRNGQTRLLALDWKKAFDSINLTSLLDALRRFGLPEYCLNMIAGVMRHRRFYVEDQGIKSATKSQQSAISHGCTLIPLLFIMTIDRVDA